MPTPRLSRRSFLWAAGVTLAGGITAARLPGHASAAIGPGAEQAPDVRRLVTGLPDLSGVPRSPNVLEILPEGTVAPEPDLLARIRLFGDMHFGFTSRARLNAVADDLATLPPPDALLTVGDDTHFGTESEYASATKWIRQWNAPFYTVTGNHTFWSETALHDETSDVLYQRFVDRWGQPMPYSWELAGVRFVGAGPRAAGPGTTQASLSLDQIDELAATLAAAPDMPTVLVMHSPLHHTVLGDIAKLHDCYTSDDPGFYQTNSEKILATLATAPQVALVINGHTHSPLEAKGLVAMLNAGDHTVPQFNAMALPFVRRLMRAGPYGGQELMTWELGIADHYLLLRGRDHLSRRLAARVTVPLSTALSMPAQPQMVQPTQGIWV